MRAAGAEAAADAAFLQAFEAGEVAPESFHHADHVRLTWTCLRLYGLVAGGDRVAAAIRTFAEIHAPGKYHETITRAWVRLVWAAMRGEPGRERFEGFLVAHPELGDKNRLRDFYSSERLWSDVARGGWVEPDVRTLPTGRPELARGGRASRTLLRVDPGAATRRRPRETETPGTGRGRGTGCRPGRRCGSGSRRATPRRS